MADVFISYARQSQPTAKRLADRLTAAGYEVWWDEQIPAHRAYAEVIEERLRAAACVIVLWSQEAAKSQWVRAEADIARAEGKLIQAVVDGCTPPLPFDQLQHTDLQGWTGAISHPGWRKIEASVRALTAAPGRLSASPPGARAERAAVFKPGPNHRLLVGAGALAVLALLAAGGWWLAGSDHGGPTTAARIALRPLTADPANTVAAAAIQDQMVSVMSAHGLAPSTLAAGSPTGSADLIVEGDLQTTDGLTRVTTRVVNSADHGALWSGTSERPAAEAAGLADQIAMQVDAVVRCGALTLRRGARMDTGTRALYMKSCALRRTLGKSDQALEALRKVAQQDPGFGPAQAELALAAALAAPQMAPGEIPALRAEAEAAADRAIKIDPNLSAAYRAKAALVRPTTNWAERERWLEKGITKPDAMSVFLDYGDLLREVGRVGEALMLARRAASLDPVPGNTNSLAALLIEAGELTEAKTIVATAQRAFPTDPYTRYMALYLVAFSDPPAGLRLLEDGATRPASFKDQGVAAWRAFVQARQEPSPAAQAKAAALLIQAVKTKSIQSDLAFRALLLLGRTADVEAFYRAGTPDGGKFNTRGLFTPQAASMRRDPRFMALANDIGLTAYWKTSGKWPDFCSEPSLPYKCEDLAR